MSTPAATVMSSDGKQAATAMPMTGGGLALSPLPLSGGRRGSRKMTKKMRKMLKTLKKLKGGVVDEVVENTNEPETEEGGRRRRRGSRRSRRGSRKGRRAGLFY